jgi:mannonate dehydratase
MAGKDNGTPGYHLSGKLFAVGYMKGLTERSAKEFEAA